MIIIVESLKYDEYCIRIRITVKLEMPTYELRKNITQFCVFVHSFVILENVTAQIYNSSENSIFQNISNIFQNRNTPSVRPVDVSERRTKFCIGISVSPLACREFAFLSVCKLCGRLTSNSIYYCNIICSSLSLVLCVMISKFYPFTMYAKNMLEHILCSVTLCTILLECE